ncbi:MAG: T9SS type A sorting domain-containing protein, partial [Bacteroidota bacterium]
INLPENQSNWVVRILDEQGRVVYEAAEDYEAMVNLLDLSIGAGAYYVQAQSPGYSLSQSFVFSR